MAEETTIVYQADLNKSVAKRITYGEGYALGKKFRASGADGDRWLQQHWYLSEAFRWGFTEAYSKV